MKLQTTQGIKKNEKGVVMILALILMTMLFLLTLSAFEMVTVNAQITDNYNRDLQVLYIAEAGIDHVIYELRYNNLVAISGTCGPGNYTVPVPNPIGTRKYSITSTGTIHNASRSIMAEVKLFKTSIPYTVVISSWKEI